MADIFISYSKNKNLPDRLEIALKAKWTVWWDKKIKGRFDSEIEAEIKKAQIFIPIWSKDFLESTVAKDELDLAQREGRHIFPVTFDQTPQAPLGFGRIDIIDLSGWDDSITDPELQRLFTKLESSITSRPDFYFSISSYDTRLKVPLALDRLKLFGASHILISAYDLHNANRSEQTKFEKNLKQIIEAGGHVLLDSGQYEASRIPNSKWTLKEFKAIVKKFPHSAVLSYDRLGTQVDSKVRISEAERAYARDSAYTKSPVWPIMHAATDANGVYDFSSLDEIAYAIASSLRPPVIAIPERELGMGILARAKKISDIRRKLSSLSFYQPLHILGTGNPISMAMFFGAGADSFDGLEWCRVAINALDGSIHHPHNFDVISTHCESINSDIFREMASNEDVFYMDRIFYNNYGFLSEFVSKLRSNEMFVDSFLQYCSGPVFHKFKNALKEGVK